MDDINVSNLDQLQSHDEVTSPSFQKWKFTRVLNNKTVIVTTVIVLAAYIILCIVIVLKKKNSTRKKKKVMVIKQLSKENTRHHPYLITMVTGTRANAGTTGFIQMRLSGKDEQTENFYLNPFLHDPQRQKFKRGTTDQFVLFADKDLGELFLTDIELQSKDPTSWYLSYVIIQDILTLTQWYFPHHGWISASDGMDFRVTLVAEISSNISVSYCHCLSLCFMCANAITIGLIKTQNPGRDIDIGQTVMYNAGANGLVSLVTSFIEVFLVMIEHRNKFDHMENKGTLSANSIFSSTLRLQRLDSSIWKDEADGYYQSFYSDHDDDDIEYGASDVFDRDYKVAGANYPNYNNKNPNEAEIIISETPYQSNCDDKISVNGSDHLIKTTGLWTPGLGYSDPLRSMMHSPYGDKIPRQLARATDSSYSFSHGMDLKKNISWNDAAELYVYSKKRPVNKGQAPYKAIVPVTAPRAKPVLKYQPIYSYARPSQRLDCECNRDIYNQGQYCAGDIHKEEHCSAFRPLLDYNKQDSIKDTKTYTDITDCAEPFEHETELALAVDNVDKSCQTDCNNNIGSLTQDKKPNDLNGLSNLKDISGQNEVLDEKHSNMKGNECNSSATGSEDKILRDLIVKKMKAFINNEIDTIVKTDNNKNGDINPIKENLESVSLQELLSPMISTFVTAIHKSVLQQTSVNEAYFREFHSGILSVLQSKLSGANNTPQKDESAIHKSSLEHPKPMSSPKHIKSTLPKKVSSLTGRSSSNNLSLFAYRASDTVLNSGHKFRKDSTSKQNVVSSDTACDNVYMQSVLLDQKSKSTSLEKSASSKYNLLTVSSSKKLSVTNINEIHNKLDLGPVQRKLSDAVVGCAYNQNVDRVERIAEEFVKLNKRSRQRLLKSLVRALSVEMTNDANKNTLIGKVSVTSLNDQSIELKSSSQDVMKNIPTKYVGQIKNEHVVKTATASLQSILSDDITERFKEIVGDFNKSEMYEFTSDVVGNLYVVVKEKLQKMISLELDTEEKNKSEAENKTDEMESSSFKSVFDSADKEVKREILPVLTDHITKLIEDEAHTLESLDVDLMMMAYGGQFVDTVVTNAVLQTHVGLVKGAKSLVDESVKNNKEINNKNISQDNKPLDNLTDEIVDTTNDTRPSQETQHGSLLVKDHMSLDDNNKTGSNANDLMTTNDLTTASSNSSRNVVSKNDSINSIQNLDTSNVILKVFDIIHKKLGHESKHSLEYLTEERKIHCALCKPRAVKEISQKIIGMTASKYITKEVFTKAIKELRNLQDKTDFSSTFCVGEKTNGDTDNENLQEMLKKVGTALTNSDTEDIKQHQKLVDDIVNDLTVYIMESACDNVAHSLITMIQNHYNEKQDLPENITVILQEEVKSLLSGYSDELEEQNIGFHNNKTESTYSASINSDGSLKDSAINNFSSDTEGINESMELTSEDVAKEKNSPESCFQTGEDSMSEVDTKYSTYYDDNTEKSDLSSQTEDTKSDTKYHTYYYDDAEKYCIGLAPWVSRTFFVCMALLTLMSFIGTIIVGMGFSEHIANHWITAVVLAVLQHILILEPLKIFFLAVFATYYGSRML